MLWQKLNVEESVVSGFEETGGCHRIMVNLNFFLTTLPWPRYTVELYRVVLNDLSLSSTEDPSHSTELFLANLLGKKIIIRCKTDLLQKKKY